MRTTIARALALLALTTTAVTLPVAAAAVAATPTQRVTWKRLSSRGDYFLNYDGGKTFARNRRDWPVGLIYWDDASVDRVKTFYGTRGFTRTGGDMFMAYSDGDLSGPAVRQQSRFDRDKGKKTACVDGFDDHFRVYGPTTDRFNDPRYGNFVVATAHIDYGDGDGECAGEDWFGQSEAVESRLGAIAAGSYSVREDAKPLGNYESYHYEGDHLWSNGGNATMVRMP